MTSNEAAALLRAEPQVEVPCDGEAHSNPHIDNCSRCSPEWGVMKVPARFPTTALRRKVKR